MRFCVFIYNSFLVLFLLKIVAVINELTTHDVYIFLHNSLLFINVSIQGFHGLILGLDSEDLQPIGIQLFRGTCSSEENVMTMKFAKVNLCIKTSHRTIATFHFFRSNVTTLIL